MAYIYDLTDTWNASGTTFNGIKLNVTDSASAVSSKLVTLQVGGTEHFSVTKAGVGYFSGNVGIGTSSPSSFSGYTSLTVNNATNGGLIEATNGTRTIRMQSQSSGSALVGTTTSHTLGLMTAGVERATIDTSGNVGIGTSSPAAKLDVSGQEFNFGAGGTTSNAYMYLNSGTSSNYGPALRLRRGGTDKWWVGLDSGINGGTSEDLDIYTGAAVNMRVYTSGAERMRIDASGNLLVGTTTASAKLAVVSSAFNGLFINAQGAASNGSFEKNNTAGGYLVFNYNNGSSISGVGSITTNGTAVTYNTASDTRLKKNIAYADDASSLIDALQVRKFDWKVNDSHQRYGFIAQELVEVAPEAVHQPANPDEMMGVDYSKLVPMLVKEVQSLRARVAQLEGN